MGHFLPLSLYKGQHYTSSGQFGPLPRCVSDADSDFYFHKPLSITSTLISISSAADFDSCGDERPRPLLAGSLVVVLLFHGVNVEKDSHPADS